jgi:small subunit ribosomal protein S9
MAETERPDQPEEPDAPAQEEAAEEPAATEQTERPVGEEPAVAAAEEEAAAAAQSAPEPEQAADEPPAEAAAEEPADEALAQPPAAEAPAEGAPEAAQPPAAEAPAGEAPEAAEPPAAEAPAEEAPAAAEPPAAEAPAEEAPAAAEPPAAEPPAAGEPAPPTPPRRERRDPQASGPEIIPGADLEPDIVPEGFDPLGRAAAQEGLPEGIEVEEEVEEAVEVDEEAVEPEERTIPQATIDLAAGARYTATGKRKTAVARVILKPGQGAYTINGRPLEDFFPRQTLQRNIRQPLETVGYESRMDVHARLHGGGVSAQAGALRHGISRALIVADPNLRGELKRRGFLTRDARAKERKKAGLKKARKRPQFSKR